jgi:hypothetical protein
MLARFQLMNRPVNILSGGGCTAATARSLASEVKGDGEIQADGTQGLNLGTRRVTFNKPLGAV